MSYKLNYTNQVLFFFMDRKLKQCEGTNGFIWLIEGYRDERWRAQ